MNSNHWSEVGSKNLFIVYLFTNVKVYDKINIYLSLTHRWHKTPPYTLFTVFFRRHIRDLSIGRAGWIPLNLSLQLPHLGIFFAFFKYWYTSFPPGVRTLKNNTYFRHFQVILLHCQIKNFLMITAILTD